MKNLNRKAVGLILVLAMVIAMSFAGCAKTPEASELLKSIGNLTDNMEANMKIHMLAETDASALGGEGTMEIGIDADLNVQQQKGLSHTTGSMSMNMFGMTFDQEMDQWTDDSGDIIRNYSYDTETEEWSVEETEKGEENANIGVPDISEDMFKTVEVKKDGKQYVLTGVIDNEKLGNTELGGLFEGVTEESDFNDINMNVELRFNSKDNQLEKMVINAKTGDNAEAKVEFNVEIEVKSTGKVSLTLPAGFAEMEPIDYYDMYYDEDWESEDWGSDGWDSEDWSTDSFED